MALITAADVTGYTAFDSVKTRTPAALDFDIIQAQQDIFAFAGHKFTDATKYNPLPGEVKLAFIKVAEYYALVNGDESFAKGIKSEKIGDYQYSVGEGKLQSFSLANLLDGHIQATGKSGFRFGMKSL